MRKIIILLTIVILCALCANTVMAAPKIDFDGSRVKIFGAYLPYYDLSSDVMLDDYWLWGINGKIQLNVHGQTLTYYSAIETELTTLAYTWGDILSWCPELQDYYWRVSIGIVYNKLGFEIFVDQYCLHEVDNAFNNSIRHQYTGIGAALTLEF